MVDIVDSGLDYSATTEPALYHQARPQGFWLFIFISVKCLCNIIEGQQGAPSHSHLPPTQQPPCSSSCRCHGDRNWPSPWRKAEIESSDRPLNTTTHTHGHMPSDLYQRSLSSPIGISEIEKLPTALHWFVNEYIGIFPSSCFVGSSLCIP